MSTSVFGCVPRQCGAWVNVRELVLQIARVTKMLADEYGTASNIKSRVNRLSVLSAITSAQQRLKLYNKVCYMCMPGTHLFASAAQKAVHIVCPLP